MICGSREPEAAIMKPRSPNKILTGVAGEYFVAAELSRRGYVATLTLRNTRGIDILASNADATKTVSIQVKTNSGKKPHWLLSQKAESDIADETIHYYVFVNLNGIFDSPRFYIVPRAAVAKFVKEGHAAFQSRGGRDNPMRVFSCEPDSKYLNAWESLDLG